jgi:diguanylate cyclase (GGDEF)-like protein
MADAAFYENCWAELLKASRAWQLHYDVHQLLTHVCRTAHDLLLFEYASVYMLENNGIEERATWPENARRLEVLNAAESASRSEIARSVIQSGRSLFLQKPSGTKSQTILCAPLTATREILGAVYLETSQADRKIAEKDQQFFGMFASQAAACLEHTLLYQSAIADPLTGLYCHRHFRQEVDQAIRRAARSEQSVTLLLMDLDHFKELNDSCGHEAGNQCLLQVAALLRSNFRTTDILARFGGDEFEILLLDATVDDGRAVAEKVREKIGQIALPQNKRVTATIGISTYPFNAVDAQTLFLRADSALYAAKEGGRNRVAVSEGKPGDAQANDSGSDERAVRLIGAPAEENGTPSRSAPKAGAVEMVDGHIIKRRLGVGSTGEVLLVMQPGLDREVALKRPLTPHTSFEQTQVFEREAKVTAGLNHPGIVPIFNIGRDQDNRRYYTMKPLNGRTLAEIIDARLKGEMDTLHAFTTGRLLEILQRVCETVAYAHAREVLHLDLTPGNVLVGEFGEVTVIDWSTGSRDSFSKASDSQGVRLVGSPSFIAPELISGSKKGTAKSDVFALGTLLYYLLTDQLPFQRATTAESIEALLKGELIAPDALKPEGGIDPMLSTLCTEALSLNPSRRPTAAAFAERLSLFLRGEMDWSTIRFGSGPGEHALREDEWTALKGQWRLDGDNWVSVTGQEAVLALKMQVPGSFRFVCESWTDQPLSEISIFGHLPVNDATNSRDRGYYFQVGAEFNTVSKLARHDNDVLVKPGFPIEPGRRYRIEMEYQDQEGLLHCALNGKRLFTYRELFPFPGSLLGLYSFTEGTHFKPIELRRQNWNLQVPALRAADRHMEFGHLDSALACYQEIAAQIPGRLQGSEATLKAGLCVAQMGDLEKGYQILARTAGTVFEPFALAEKAYLQLNERNPGCFKRGMDTFRELFRCFPDSQARIRVYDAAILTGPAHSCPDSRESSIQVLAELNHLATISFDPPAQSLLSSASRAVTYRTWLGRWKEALREWQIAAARFSEAQQAIQNYNAPFLVLALALDQPELFPRNIQADGMKGNSDWYTGIILHHAVHFSNFDEWYSRIRSSGHFRLANLLLSLARTDSKNALNGLDELLNRFGQIDNLDSSYRLGMVLAESQREDFFKRFLSTYGSTNQDSVRTTSAYFAVQRCEFDAAAKLLTDLYEPTHMIYACTRVLLQVMLGSLGFLKSPSLEKVRSEARYYLYGTLLDLALIFLGEREPIPNELWPSPHWRPEWRLLLGIWLEAKGRGKEARAIVLPARDPRYGWTHAQPGIEALLERTAPR